MVIKRIKLATLCLFFLQTVTYAHTNEICVRTCPCAMVPEIGLNTDVQKIIKAYKTSSARGQRSQLEGFIYQYVDSPNEVTEAVLLGCAKVYSERTNNHDVYYLVEDVVYAKNKKPAQKKALLAIGKILKDKQGKRSFDSYDLEKDVASFRQLSPTQQRVRLANYAEQFAQDPREELELVLIGCAQIYCERVQSQSINKLIRELIAAYDKDAVIIKIKQALSLRNNFSLLPYKYTH